MTANAIQTAERLSIPSVASIIFAPKPENYDLLSFCAKTSTPEAILEFFVQPDEKLTRRILENFRRAIIDNPGIVLDCLREYGSSSCATVTQTLPTNFALALAEQVPARTFPFATHLNLLASSEEGWFFDPDALLEH
ncbi:MAG: hypothetical protein HYS38_07035 [Acidobacteria bacterium]|nr:hypothetical protein [Acidobacteriota bacterium]